MGPGSRRTRVVFVNEYIFVVIPFHFYVVINLNKIYTDDNHGFNEIIEEISETNNNVNKLIVAIMFSIFKRIESVEERYIDEF